MKQNLIMKEFTIKKNNSHKPFLIYKFVETVKMKMDEANRKNNKV